MTREERLAYMRQHYRDNTERMNRQARMRREANAAAHSAAQRKIRDA